jgi:5'-methylthioadenosine phosphorylase
VAKKCEMKLLLCTEGPRFETLAEIEMFGGLSYHVVGMTVVPEVGLARELVI